MPNTLLECLDAEATNKGSFAYSRSSYNFTESYTIHLLLAVTTGVHPHSFSFSLCSVALKLFPYSMFFVQVALSRFSKFKIFVSMSLPVFADNFFV